MFEAPLRAAEPPARIHVRCGQRTAEQARQVKQRLRPGHRLPEQEWQHRDHPDDGGTESEAGGGKIADEDATRQIGAGRLQEHDTRRFQCRARVEKDEACARRPRREAQNKPVREQSGACPTGEPKAEKGHEAQDETQQRRGEVERPERPDVRQEDRNDKQNDSRSGAAGKRKLGRSVGGECGSGRGRQRIARDGWGEPYEPAVPNGNSRRRARWPIQGAFSHVARSRRVDHGQRTRRRGGEVR